MKNHVIVTGMHRSGTSYLIRALSLCGLYLGPETDFYDTEITPKFGNPRGHWENVNVIKINEKILKINEGAWDEIPKSSDKIPNDLADNTKQLLDTFYSINSLGYGMKDPRFSLTFDKWKQFVPSIVLVGIFRHPLKVAESLKIRNGFSYEKSLELWLEYNKNLLKYINENNGFLLDFDWPSERLVDETKQVAKKIGLMDIDFSYWFSKDLKKSDKSSDISYKLPSQVIELYEKLKEVSNKNTDKPKLDLPQLTLNDYKKITSDNLAISNSFYQRSVNQAKDEIQRLRSSAKDILENPLGALLSIYNEREDLQKLCPEADDGDIYGLVNWAQRVCSGEISGEIEAKQQIFKFENWYKKSYQQLKLDHEKIDETINSLEEKKSQVSTLENERNNLQYARNNLQYEIAIYAKELQNIKSSFGFRVIRSLGSKIDKISGKSSPVAGIKPTISASIRVIEDEGFSSFLGKAKERVNRRDFSVLTAQYETIPKYKTSHKDTNNSTIQDLQYVTKRLPYDDEILYDSLFNVSLVVPTNSTLNKLQELIKIVSTQKGIESLEIILVNSGNDDLKSLQKLETNLNSDISKLTIKIIDIDSSQFNHGRSRNLGATNATNDYLIFMTDDALPFSENLFYQMCDTLDSNYNVVASTAKQIIRSDSDLMSSYSTKYFYNILKLVDDRIVSCDDFDKLDSAERRRVAQIDDVCSCYRREVFSKHQYKELVYAEDIELGVRLVRDGHKIAQLSSVGVIHSHIRSSSYYLKRQFIETLVLFPLLKYPIVSFSQYKISSLSDLISSHILPCYVFLNQAIENLNLDFDDSKIDSNKNNIDQIFSSFYSQISKFSPENNSKNANRSDPSLDTLFQELFGDIKNNFQNLTNDSKSNIIMIGYLDALKGFEEFMKSVYPNLQGLEDDFISTLYKIFGSTVGSVLGSYLLDQINHELSTAEQEKLQNESVHLYFDYDDYIDTSISKLKENLIQGV